MKKYFVTFTFLTALLLAGFLAIQKAQAAFPGEGLTISPPINEPKVKPGQTVENIIRVTNPTSEMVEVYPQVMDFRAGGEGGEPSFYTSTGDSDKFSLAKWVSFDVSRIALTPEQVVEFKYTLTVPVDAEPGGHYGAVFFVSEPPKSADPGSKVSIGSMVGSLVLLTVPGETIEKGFVEEFLASKNIFITGNKASFTTKISNVGNVHFKPLGKINIKPIIGKSAETLVFNDQSGNILPDSTRKFSNEWKYPWYEFGYFRAELAAVYGISDKPLTATYSFWIIPWWLIVTAVILILGIVALCWWLLRKKSKVPNKSKDTNSPIILR